MPAPGFHSSHCLSRLSRLPLPGSPFQVLLLLLLQTLRILLLVLPLRGEALAMESDVRELRRLQGRLPGSKIILEDHGLTSDARCLAQYLADREPNAVLETAKDR